MASSPNRPEMRCRTCGYDLRGLTETRCPECGRAFDPGDPETYLVKPIRAERLLAMVGLGIIVLALPMALARSDDVVERIPFILIPLFPILIVVGASIGGTIAWRCTQIVRSRHPWVERRWALLPAIVIGGGVFAWFVLATIGQSAYYLLFR